MEAVPSPIDEAQLTEILRRSGRLGDARVRTVEVVSARATLVSRITRLHLAYDGAAGDAPGALILKTGLPDGPGEHWDSGRREIAFYRDVAAAMKPGLVPRCFDAAWNQDTKAWLLLLEDLTDTHEAATAWPLPPSAAQSARIVQTLARFHAAWWDDPRLGSALGAWSSAAETDRHLERFAAELAHFVDRMADRLSPARRDLFARLLDRGPRLSARYHSHRNMTIVHGDAHVWNCFLPRDGGDADGSGDARFFDWDGWRLDTAADDLAYMMAMHWYPDRRRQMERSLLDCYHAALLANGVRTFDRRALDDDYRLSALWQITRPVWQAAAGIPPVIWWNNLERSLLAVDDLDCHALLA
jgi:hypothetical protein